MYFILSGDFIIPGSVIKSDCLCGLWALSRNHVARDIQQSTAALSKGGTAMFALLALGGDMGCAGGPTLVGMISDSLGDNLKMGILAGIIFPVLLLLGILRCKKGNTLS